MTYCNVIFSYFISNFNVEFKIRPDIQYLAFRLAFYPSGRISCKIRIRCIPTTNKETGTFMDVKLTHTITLILTAWKP
jgi:hypothetical protein